MYDIIIIGGGPAGLTAGLYAARARLKVLLIDNPLIPSQAMVTAEVENYPGFPESICGPEIVERIKKQGEQAGIEFTNGEVKSIKSIDTKWQVNIDDKAQEAFSLIIASGARPKELGVPGEKKFCGRGVSYCAVCDGALFRNKDIVVVGGGDTAIEEALFLTRFVKSIKIIHRRDRLRAAKILEERVLKDKKVEVIWNSNVKEILGEARVEGVRVMNTKTVRETTIPCDGVFIFVGLIPNTGFINSLVELDNDNYIITDDNMHTSKEGIFACGDCRRKSLRQIITACGDGATAAHEAQKYVERLKGEAYV